VAVLLQQDKKEPKLILEEWSKQPTGNRRLPYKYTERCEENKRKLFSQLAFVVDKSNRHTSRSLQTSLAICHTLDRLADYQNKNGHIELRAVE
jgi:hypothetical protein